MRIAFWVSTSAPDAPPPAWLGRARHRRRAHRFASAILGLLLALLAALSVVFTLPAAAADAITAIEITGNRTVEASAVQGNLALAVGSPYDAAKADQSIKALHATGLFNDVRIDRRGSIVHVTVVENPVVGRVELEGNAAIDKSKLEEQIQLKPRMRYTTSKAHADAVRIREIYRRQGRLATTVEPKVTKLADGRVDVAYIVSEGEVTKVDSINFVGNRQLAAGELRDVISTSQSGWFDILKTAAFYDPQRLEQDKELLRRHYLKQGFPDARIVSAEAVKNTQGTGYSITFTVEEGERFTFAPATVESSLTGADTQALRDLVAVRPGSVYSQEAVEKSVEKMMLALSDQGLPSAEVKPAPKRDAAGRTIAIAFHIGERPRITVERIEIAGNTNTKDFVIRRAFRISEGDAVNAFLVERGRKRVQALGFFKSVTLKSQRGSAPDKVVLVIEVVEDQTIDFGIGVGYSTSEGVVGDISIAERNLFGNGQWLRLKLAGSQQRFQAEVGFTEPHFLGRNVAAGFDLFYKDVDYTNQASYKAQRVGGTLRARHHLTDEWSVGVNYTFVRSTLYDVGPAASAAIKEAIPGYPDATSNTYNTSSIGYSLAYDTRDNKRRPNSGVYYSLAQDMAGVGGDVRFIRSVGEARAYYPVTDEITAMGRVTGGTISGWGGQDVRLLDLFYKGSETVRGFAVAGYGPRDTLSANQDALGGRMFYATTAELLFPIPGVPRDLGLRGAVFADAGSLWGLNSTAASQPGAVGGTPALRASVGAGLVWDSPIGSLRADYAVPLLKQPYDKTQNFSFGLMPF
jgi:outer membrane protein insertion porin family